MAVVSSCSDLTLSFRLGPFILAMGKKGVSLLEAMTARCCSSQTFDIVFGIIILSKTLFLIMILRKILQAARSPDFVGTVIRKRICVNAPLHTYYGQTKAFAFCSTEWSTSGGKYIIQSKSMLLYSYSLRGEQLHFRILRSFNLNGTSPFIPIQETCYPTRGGLISLSGFCSCSIPEHQSHGRAHRANLPCTSRAHCSGWQECSRGRSVHQDHGGMGYPYGSSDPGGCQQPAHLPSVIQGQLPQNLYHVVARQCTPVAQGADAYTLVLKVTNAANAIARYWAYGIG